MKSVSISEGGKGRVFPQTDKLKINNVGGGNSLWLPEEEVVTGTLYADENGIYLAENDGFSCYDTVVVRVEDETDPDDPDWELDPDELDEDVWDEESLEEFQEDPEAFEEKFNDKEKWKAEKAKKEKSQKIKKVKSLKPSKITGIDPVDGNPYEVGVDSEGNLTKEMLPSSIHIVVPPWEREYENGEEINFYGMHVYLLDKDGHPFKTEQYPTGEIPFEELLLPVTTVDGSGQQGDGDSISYEGVNATLISFYDPRTMNENLRKGYASSFITGSRDGNNYCYVALESGLSALITRYNGIVYTKSNVEEYSFNAYFGKLREKGSSYDFIVSNRNISFTNGGFHRTFAEDERTVNIPESTIDPSTVDVPIKKGLDIPVQWMRSDGEMLEDSFLITVTEETNNESNSGTSDSGSGHTSGGF